MSQRSCGSCGKQQEADRVYCEACGSLLPRVRLGERFQGRLLVDELLEERSNLRSYSIRIDSGSEAWILREFFPKRRPDAEAIALANRVAAVLEGGRAGIARLEEWFEDSGCIYTIEPTPAGVKLAKRVQEGRLGEDAAAQLFWQMVAFLEEFGSEPAIYHGGISPANITLGPDGTISELSEPTVIFEVIDSLRPPSAGDSLVRDLPAAGFAILSSLSGQTASDLAEHAEVRQQALSKMTDKELALALAWATSPTGGPECFADLRALRGRLGSALSDWQKKHWAQARESLNAAQQLHPSPVITSLLERLAREEAEERRQEAPAQTGSPVSGAATAAQPAAEKKSPPPPPGTGVKVQPAPVPTRPPSRRTLFAAGSGALVVLAGWWLYTPNTSAFKGEIEQGRLLGDVPSAYMLYKSQNPTSRTAAKMREIAHPILARYSNETFDDFYRTSILKETNWRQCRQAHEWLKEIEPDNPEVAARYFYASARVALDDKRNDQAIEHFQSALRLRKDWDLAVLGTGIGYLRMRNERTAEQYYLQAARISPDWVFPRMNLAELYLLQRQDRLVDAEVQAREAVRCDSGRPTAVELLGRVLYLRQKYREACGVLGQALELARGTQSRLDLRSLERRRQNSCELAK